MRDIAKDKGKKKRVHVAEEEEQAKEIRCDFNTADSSSHLVQTSSS